MPVGSVHNKLILGLALANACATGLSPDVPVPVVLLAAAVAGGGDNTNAFHPDAAGEDALG
jgi:hypothetical protein